MAVIIAAFMLPATIYPTKVRKVLMDFVSDSKVMRLTGFITLMIGFVFLSVHYKFTEGWFMTISILGWISIVKGLGLLWFPEMANNLFKEYYNTDAFFRGAGIVTLLVSIGLIYIAIYPLAPVVMYY